MIRHNKYILTGSLEYNDVELTKELVNYFIKDNSMPFIAFGELMRSTINNSQVDIFAEVLKEFISIDKKDFIERYSSIKFCDNYRCDSYRYRV